MNRARRVRRSRVAAMVLALAAVVLAGCAGIPGAGQPQDVQKVAEQVDPTAPQAPDPGQPADQIVRGFISATARTDYDAVAGRAFAQAREYLTPEADTAWSANTGSTPVVVIEDGYAATPKADDPGTIVVTGNQVGTLAADRSFQPVDDKPFTATLHLVETNGEWRITDPPSEVIVTESGFATAFRQRTVYFLDSTGRVVVPDIRYIPDSGTTELAVSRLMDLLLHGPSERISGAARTQLGPTAGRSNIQVDNNGVAHIDLEGVDVSTSAARQGLVAQIVWTLYPDVQSVRLTVNGEPLASLAAAGTATGTPTPTSATPGNSDSTPGGPTDGGAGPATSTYSISDVADFDPDAVPGTGQAISDAYYIDPDGAILRLSDSTPMWGPVGTGSLQVRSAALSAATGTLAAVADAGENGVQLIVGHPFDQEIPTAVIRAQTLTQPSFTRSGDEVWVVQNGATQPEQNGATQPEVYRITTTGTPTWTKVPAQGLAGIGKVTALSLSPDGVRVAVVADGKLFLGSIAPVSTGSGDAGGQPGDRPAEQITKLSVLREDLTDVGPVTFKDATTLLVGARETPGSHRTVYQVGIDGENVDPVSSSGIFADVDSIAAASGDQPMLISFGPPDRVWQFTGSEWVSPAGAQWLSGTGPFYPN